VPGGPRSPLCFRRVLENVGGFASYPQMLLAGAGGNVFVRDLHEQDTLALQMYPGRSLWILTEAPRVGGGFRLTRAPLDSLHAEWALDREAAP
jgi:hypothetical protein